MTTSEILKADLLDIIFDQRNKDYGAYALRKQYNHRLLLSLSAMAAFILAFILITALRKKELVIPVSNKYEGFVLKTFEDIPPKQPERPKEIIRPRTVDKIARIKHTSQINIKPNEKVTTVIPALDDLKGKQIDNITTDGKPNEGIVKPAEPGITNHGADKKDELPAAVFIPVEKQPEYPGGLSALMRFFHKNLETPEELQAGETKTVMVKFKIDIDGSVGDIQVIQSAGAAFDREVIRVCRKMPRWTPGFQNGVNVPIYYQLPITFMGLEEE